MSSKNTILEAIRKNKPSGASLPELPSFGISEKPEEKFQEALVQNGGKAFKVQNLNEINAYIQSNFSKDLPMLSMVEGLPGNMDIKAIQDPHDLEKVELAILRGEWGVSENAAIWLPEEALGHRVLPFITQHLIVLLESDKLVGNMHEVYQKINVSRSGYGVFVAGPSKTADIEQSLIIGAHGPRSMTVFLVG